VYKESLTPSKHTVHSAPDLIPQISLITIFEVSISAMKAKERETWSGQIQFGWNEKEKEDAMQVTELF